MSTPNFLDILLAILLGLSQPAGPAKPAAASADTIPAPAQPAPEPVCARRVVTVASGSARAIAELTAGPDPIAGEVTFVFEQRQGTSGLSGRLSDEVRLAPGGTMTRTFTMSVNGVTDPEVQAILPDGTTLPCR